MVKKIMKCSAKGRALIKEFEKLELVAYKCPAGIWTIGYGSTFYEDKRPVKKGDRITKARAEQLFDNTLRVFEDGVNKLLKKPVTQNQFDALVSFAFNVGLDMDDDLIAEGLGDSTLLKKVNANPNDRTIGQEFMKWVYSGGKKLDGLVRRRAKEYALYITP